MNSNVKGYISLQASPPLFGSLLGIPLLPGSRAKKEIPRKSDPLHKKSCHPSPTGMSGLHLEIMDSDMDLVWIQNSLNQDRPV